MPAVKMLVPRLAPCLIALLFASGVVTARADEVDTPSPAAVAASGEPVATGAEAEAKSALAVLDDVETGIASWYGRNFHNKRTASGEAFDAKALTAAHPTLPFDSWVRVTLLSTGRSVIVRITDRGPHIANRLIDISRAAAAKIGLVQRGAGTVRIEPLAEAPPALAAPVIR